MSYRLDGEETPRLGHAAEVVAATICEAQAGARHQIFDRGRHDHLARSGGVHHAGGNVHPDARHVLAPELYLAGMESGADLDAERLHAGRDRLGATDGARRAVEGGQDAVAGVLHQPPTIPLQLSTDEGVVLVEEIFPPPVPDL